MLKCHACPKRKFKNVDSLRQHFDTKKHFQCPSCAAPFKNSRKVFEHAQVAHMSHKTLCITCWRMFSSADALESHLLASSKHRKCASCRIGFQTPAAFDAHINEVHGNRRLGISPGPRSLSPATDTDRSTMPSPNLRSPSPPSSIASLTSNNVTVLRKIVEHSRTAVNDLNTGNTTSRIGDDKEEIVATLDNAYRVERNDHETDKNDTQEVSSSATLQLCIEERVSPSAIGLSSFITELRGISNASQKNTEDVYSDAKFAFPSTPPNGDVCFHPNSDPSAIIVDGIDMLGVDEKLTDPRETSAPTDPVTDSPSRSPIPFPESNADPSEPSPLEPSSAQIGQVSSRRLRRTGTLTARTFFQLSSLPTISDEEESNSEKDDSESPMEPASGTLLEVPELQLPPLRRKRRLSLLPSLPSIPETPVGPEMKPSLPIGSSDSDSDSSQGINEHRAEEFLYDGFSENERSQTPMSYLTADELEPDSDVEVEKDVGRSSPPLLLVEDLTRLVQELSPPSTTTSDFFDPSSDPFELHPSANNSPMSATFPKRLRAWSLSAPKSNGRFLSPSASSSVSGSTAQGNTDGELETMAVERLTTVADGPDEEAISADEPPLTIIEEDLFSEPNEMLHTLPQNLHDVVEQVHVVDEVQFVEEGHPLRSFISMLPAHSTVSDVPDHPHCTMQEHSQIQDQGREGSDQDSTFRAKPILHCRLCQLDPCRELTATFCGHIFCYECITQEIMVKSKCPVCNTPTLLYCLFKLDLNA